MKQSGHVFNPIRLTAVEGNSICRTTDWVSKIGSRIGKKAGVIVSESRSSESKTKYASFHDLRRSFGATWASRVLPQVLMKLMRHDSIDTTLRYYVGDEAEQMAAQLWGDFNCEN